MAAACDYRFRFSRDEANRRRRPRNRTRRTIISRSAATREMIVRDRRVVNV